MKTEINVLILILVFILLFIGGNTDNEALGLSGVILMLVVSVSVIAKRKKKN
jgi:LPXTG-motif cell wall-anchored protein